MSQGDTGAGGGGHSMAAGGGGGIGGGGHSTTGGGGIGGGGHSTTGGVGIGGGGGSTTGGGDDGTGHGLGHSSHIVQLLVWSLDSSTTVAMESEIECINNMIITRRVVITDEEGSTEIEIDEVAIGAIRSS